jgi:hypothetical protein
VRAGVFAGLLLAGRALGAQAAAQLDVEAASVRAVGFAQAGGLSVSPSARFDVPFFSFAGDGALAVYGTRRYTGQVAGEAAAHATFRRLSVEGSIAAAHLTFRQEANRVSATGPELTAPVARSQSEVAGRGRADLALGAWSVWASGGRRKLQTGPTRSSLDGEAGVQRAFERAVTSIGVHTSEFRRIGWAYVFVPQTFLSSMTSGVASFPDTVRRWQHDLLSSTSVLAGRAEVSMDVGLRVSGWKARERWASVAASWRLDERLTVIGSAGRYPPDPVRALPSARFATLGMRIQRGRPPFEDWFRAPDLPPFRIDTLGGGGRVVRVRAPRAIRMELTGDFTDWTTLPMRAGDRGEWELVLPIAPGTYRVSVRADGGRWRAPPGLVPIFDEFGSESAVIVVR